MFVDFLQNGQGFGAVGEQLAHCRFDPGLLRPYIDGSNQRCVTISNGRGKREKRLISELINNGITSPVFNATTLRKDEWIQLDSVVIKAARARLRAWADLAASNTFSLNGMSKTLLEHETASDPGFAIVDMDGLGEGQNDQPRYQLEGLPLPITHSDFHFSARKLAESRNSGTPIDTRMAEAAGRRVAEVIEQTTIGVTTGLTYGNATANGYGRTPSVYGYTNFTNRNTKTDLTAPTGSNPEAIMTDVLEMLDLMYADNFFGPFILYHSTGYSRYLSDDYFRTGSTSAVRSLRERILEIDGISDIRRLDYLTSGYQLILVQMTPDVCRAVNGMDITTVQWESVGGMRLNFKVMAIHCPQIFADFSGACGVVHGTTA